MWLNRSLEGLTAIPKLHRKSMLMSVLFCDGLFYGSHCSQATKREQKSKPKAASVGSIQNFPSSSFVRLTWKHQTKFNVMLSITTRIVMEIFFRVSTARPFHHSHSRSTEKVFGGRRKTVHKERWKKDILYVNSLVHINLRANWSSWKNVGKI